MNTRADVLRRIDAYLAEKGMTDRQLGLAAAKDKRLIQRIRASVGVRLTMVEKLEAYMGDNP